MIKQTLKTYSEPFATANDVPARVQADLDNAALGRLIFCGCIQLSTNIIFWAVYEYDTER